MQSQNSNNTGTVLGIDVGERRIGMAVASWQARIARPLITLSNDDHVFVQLGQQVHDQAATALVVGLPRGLQGQHTDQTRAVEDFVRQCKAHITLPIYWQDEALTSAKAKEELEGRGKPYAKGDIDALAATYILDDFLQLQPHHQEAAA
jgi:putative Holliday junction resolvase